MHMTRITKSEGIGREVRLGRVRFESKYLAIQYYHEEKDWSIRWMCRQVGISKAAYYKWLHRVVPGTERENLLLAELIQEYDEQYNHILDYRRMTLWINPLECSSIQREPGSPDHESHWRSFCYSQTDEKIQEVYTRKNGGKYPKA